jgi:hypothetical protein
VDRGSKETTTTTKHKTKVRSMSYSIPPNATSADIEAIVENGLEALFEAHQAGVDVPNVAFMHGAGEDINEDTEIPADEVEESCPVCGEDPCVFYQHAEHLLAFDEAEHGSLAQEDVPPNNIRRKLMYRQMTLLINGGPMGRVRKELPQCVVTAIREMVPSESYMGFRELPVENNEQEAGAEEE